MKGKCNRDCFNCIYDDCILDDCVADSSNSYYYRNREKCIARAIQWKKEHPERTKEIAKKSQKNYYMKHREERLAYFKEYSKRRKEQCTT